MSGGGGRLPVGVFRVPLFGIGVKATAKRFLYKVMNAPNLGLKITRLHQVRRGAGGGGGGGGG